MAINPTGPNPKLLYTFRHSKTEKLNDEVRSQIKYTCKAFNRHLQNPANPDRTSQVRYSLRRQELDILDCPENPKLDFILRNLKRQLPELDPMITWTALIKPKDGNNPKIQEFEKVVPADFNLYVLDAKSSSEAVKKEGDTSIVPPTHLEFNRTVSVPEELGEFARFNKKQRRAFDQNA